MGDATTDVIDTLIRAISTFDASALRSICHPTMCHWSSVSRREQGLDLLVLHIARERSVIEHSDATIRARVSEGDHSVIALDITGILKDGLPFTVAVALSVVQRDNRIERIDEIADVSRCQTLLERLG